MEIQFRMSFIILVMCMFAGCNDRSNVGYDSDYEQQLETYNRQSEETDTQLEWTNRQLEASEANIKKLQEQNDRYDRILEKWEAQAERQDKILDAMERIVEKFPEENTTENQPKE